MVIFGAHFKSKNSTKIDFEITGN